MSYARTQVDLLDDGRLNDIATLVAGCEFESLGPEQRVKIIDLVLKLSMAEDIYEIRYWFEKSKLYEGP